MTRTELISYLEDKGFERVSDSEHAKKYKIKDEELRNIQGKKKIREVFMTILYEFKVSGIDTNVNVYYITDDTKVKRYTGKLSKMSIDESNGNLVGLKLLK